jgi:hypothetical protein
MWDLAAPLKDVTPGCTSEELSATKATPWRRWYLAVEKMVPGYTPAGGGKPCAGVVYLPAHRQGPGYP